MQNHKKQNFHNEISNMLRLANFGLKSVFNEVKKPILKEDEEDFLKNIKNVFNNPEFTNQLKNFETEGEKVILPIELKAAMLATTLNVYQANLLNLYTHYEPFTRGTQKMVGGDKKDKNFIDDKGTLFDKPSVEKFKGANYAFQSASRSSNLDLMKHKYGANWEKEFKDIISAQRVPITYHDGHIQSREMSDDEKKATAKFIHEKTYKMISYVPSNNTSQGTQVGGLTSLGKAQLEFLARAYTQKPADDKEALLFNILKDEGNYWSSIAENVIYGFYSLVMIPYIMILTKRSKYNVNDEQLRMFIEIGIKHALSQLKSAYDPSRGNLGTFIITSVKNNVINQLSKISTLKVDTSYVYDYLWSHQGPIKVYSVANPANVNGHYNDVIKVREGGKQKGDKVTRTIYAYVYNNPMDVLQDLERDGRQIEGNSPLAKSKIVNPSKNIFYKSVSPTYDDIKEPMGIEDEQNPYENMNIFKFQNIPQQAKTIVSKILDNIIYEFYMQDKEHGLKNISAFIVENVDFVRNLMFSLLQYGDMIEVYTKAWIVPNQKGTTTTIPPMYPVKVTKNEKGKVSYVPNIEGEIPTDEDITWIWSSGSKSEEDIKKTFYNNFINKMMQKPPVNGKKPIPDEFRVHDKVSQDIINKLYGAMKYYFGATSVDAPNLKKNRQVLNVILHNYSSAELAGGFMQEAIKRIREIIK